jgi:glycosyltransferase involved in cell wall biosynthesis
MHVLGIPLHKAEPSRVQKRSEVPDILFVGRLVPKKGLSFLLRACSLLSERGYRYRLVIVGDGPLAEVHRAESSRLGVTAEFLGALPPPRVREQLASARIFAMPSTQASDGDNEGLPIVSLEAQAAELPIVAFAQGPVLEAVHDGVNGLLAPDKSVEGLAAALGALLDDEAMCRRMGAAGRAIVEEQFDVEARTGELEEIYRDLLVAEAVQRR